jgi:hypothetical protein
MNTTTELPANVKIGEIKDMPESAERNAANGEQEAMENANNKQDVEMAQANQTAIEGEPAAPEQQPVMKPEIEFVTEDDRILKPGINFFRDVAIVTVPVHTRTTNGMVEGLLGWSPLVVASNRTMQFLAGGTVNVGEQTFEFAKCPKVIPKLARWDHTGIMRFCDGEQVDPVSVFRQMVCLHRKYIDYRDEGTDLALALWAIGTYFYTLFPAYPYVELNGPRGSGKSKQMNLTAQLAFNGRIIVNATQGTVFRIIEDERGALCFDEAEKYGEGKATSLMQMLNEGYTAGSTVPRCDPKTLEVREYEVYSPKMFASIRGIDSTTASRCIRIQYLRSKDKKRGDSHVGGTEENWAEIRHGLYSLALSEFRAVREAYTTKDVRPFSNRDNQKWAPLLALAKVIEDRGAAGVFDRVLKFARDTIHESVECNLPPFDLAVVHTLFKHTKNTPTLDVAPLGLLSRVQQNTNEKWKEQTAQLTGYTLRRLGFKRSRNRCGSFYKVTHKDVLDLADRYDVVLEAKRDGQDRKAATPATRRR